MIDLNRAWVVDFQGPQERYMVALCDHREAAKNAALDEARAYGLDKLEWDNEGGDEMNIETAWIWDREGSFTIHEWWVRKCGFENLSQVLPEDLDPKQPDTSDSIDRPHQAPTPP
jgi:hypothetical protein